MRRRRRKSASGRSGGQINKKLEVGWHCAEFNLGCRTQEMIEKRGCFTARSRRARRKRTSPCPNIISKAIYIIQQNGKQNSRRGLMMVQCRLIDSDALRSAAFQILRNLPPGRGIKRDEEVNSECNAHVERLRRQDQKDSI
jgi:hypothetical protein